MRKPRSLDLLLALLAAGAVVPLWLVDRLPLQDLPQHLVAIRALVDYHDPELGFSRFFELDLWSTQYVAYYLAVVALGNVLNVNVANTVVLSLALAGTPYAMRSLLRAIGRDERLCFFTLPFLYNIHLILGFLNFVAAIPLMLYGLALAARLRDRWTAWGALRLGALGVVLFLTHVVPFGIFGLGTAAIAVERKPRAVLARLLPLVPALGLALFWSQSSPAGRSTVEAALGGGVSSPRARFDPIAVSLRDGWVWLIDILKGSTDEIVLVGTLVLAMTATGLHWIERRGDRGMSARAELESPRALRPSQPSQPSVSYLRLIGLAPLCVLLYLLLPRSYDWIWPINARFPILAVLFAILVLPALRGLGGRFVVVALALLSAFTFVQTGRAFLAVEREEMGRLDEAIATIPKGSKVAGLIFDRESAYVRFAPFLHSVAWVQAERGGVALFTFADFPQSPLRFREADRPPRVRRGWEWGPTFVRPDRDLAWCDYVLVRGGPGAIERSRAFKLVFRSPRWQVYQRSKP